MKRQPLAKLRESIEAEAKYVDIRPSSNNIIYLLLRQIAESYSQASANKAIRDLKLDDLGWSEKL